MAPPSRIGEPLCPKGSSGLGGEGVPIWRILGGSHDLGHFVRPATTITAIDTLPQHHFPRILPSRQASMDEGGN
jgi:hypothetical protein